MRRVVIGGLSLVALVLALSVVPGSAQANRSAFTATASARLLGVDLLVSPTIVFNPLFDGGQAVAQAQVDSLGTSSAYAANPYPGAVVIGADKLLGTLTGGEIGDEEIPDFPLYVSSSHPTAPSGHRDAGSVVLDAASSSVASTSTATDGATRAAASAASDPATGDVLARAESVVGSLQLGELLVLNGVHSVAEVKKAPTGELQRTTAFEVAALTILGQRVAVTAEGLAVAGTDLPLGGALNSTLQPLLAALAAQGVTIETFPAVELEDGVSAAGLRITMPVTPPPELASGVETITAVLTVGGNIASVSNTALPDFKKVPSIVPPASPSPGGAFGSVGSPSFGSVPSAGGAGGFSAVTPAAPSAGTAPAATPAASVSVPHDISIGGFYPVLALAAAGLFAAARLFAHFGGTAP